MSDEEFDFVYNIVLKKEGEDGKVTLQGFLNVLRAMKRDYDRYVGVGVS